MADILFRDFGDSNGDLVLACGFRVFINGVDVTDHVTGSVSWSYGERGTENSCSFTLDNNNDKFILRAANMGLSGQLDASRSYQDPDNFSTSEPWKITKLRTGKTASFIASKQAESRGLAHYSETAKRDLYLQKLAKRVTLEAQDNTKYNLRSNINPKTGTVTDTTYPDISLYEGLFSTQACIINIMDQVRLYVLDPNRDPVIASESLWIPAFTGFVMSAPPERDFETGQSTISVTCSDIRTLLKRKRVLVNSASADQITPAISNKNGLFRDVILQNSNTSNAFADSSLTFEKLVSLALMGVRYQDTGYAHRIANYRDYCLKYGDTGATDQWTQLRNMTQLQVSDTGRMNKDGFGALWFGYYYMYDTRYAIDNDKGENSEREKFMNAWNRLTVFGMNQDYLTWDQMQAQGKGTRPDGMFSALNAYVHMLVPSGGAEISNLMDKLMIDQMGAQREYASVGEILEQVCERIDYQYTVTGAGDIVFEFPMYDFRAQDMGDEFKAVCAVSDSVKNDSINEEANSNPITSLKVSGGLTDQLNSVQGTADIIKAYKYTVYVTHDLLAARYGYSEEEYLVPFITNGPNKQSDQDYQRSLAMFGCFEFLKRLTEMSAMTITAGYNPFIRPNRPYYYSFGRRLSVTTSIQNTMALFQNANTTVDSKYVRRIHDTTGKIIAFGASMAGESGALNGASALPLNYSNKDAIDTFFDNEKYLAFVSDMFNSGINIQIPTSVGYTGAANTGFTSIVSQSVTQHICGWSADAKKAFDSLCSKYGIQPRNMLSVMLQESGLSTLEKNTTAFATPSGRTMKTYTVGMFQMYPANVVQTLRNHPELTAKYSATGDPNDPSTNLTGSRYYRKKTIEKGFYTPNSLAQSPADDDFSNKEAFVRAFQRCFSTPQSQIELYDAFVNDSLKSVGGSKYKLDSLEKLAMLQSSTGNLANVNNLQKLKAADRQHYTQYLKQINGQLSAADRAYETMSSGCIAGTQETSQPSQITTMSSAGTGIPNFQLMNYRL